jgi:hypothetical protein
MLPACVTLDSRSGTASSIPGARSASDTSSPATSIGALGTSLSSNASATVSITTLATFAHCKSLDPEPLVTRQ